MKKRFVPPGPSKMNKAQRRWFGLRDSDADPVVVPENVPGLKYWKKDGVVIFDKRAP